MFDPETVDTSHRPVSYSLPESLIRWIEQRAADRGEKNASAELRAMLRKLAKLEQAERESKSKQKA